MVPLGNESWAGVVLFRQLLKSPRVLRSRIRNASRLPVPVAEQGRARDNSATVNKGAAR